MPIDHHAACPLALVLSAGFASMAFAQSETGPPADRGADMSEEPTDGVLGVDPSLTFELDEVLVTATRTRRTSFQTPFSTHRVTADQIRERSYRTTPEALSDVPGVLVQKTSHGQGSPYIRGFTGFRTVFLVDGIRLNNSVFRDGPNQYWNTVDPFSLDRLEVVKGPSSVLHGSDAIGGTVAAYTHDADRFGGGFGGSALYRYSSAENAHVGRLSGGYADGGFAAVAGVTLKSFGDLEAGAPTNRQDNTGYDEYDVDFKTELWLDDYARLVLGHQTVRINNAPRTHRTVFAQSFEGTTLGSDLRRDLDQERNLTYLQYRADGMTGGVESMALSLSWQRQDETRDRIRGGGARDLQGFEVNTLGVWSRFTSETPIGRLTYGAEWYRDFVSSFSTNNAIQGQVADDATYDLVGVYLQNEIDVTDATTLILGGRFNYARADAGSVQDPQTGLKIGLEDDWSSFVFSARVTHAIVEDRLNVYGGVSQGFRAPNLSDLTRLDTARTNEIETPSPGLDPEEFLTYEVGLKTRGDWWAAQASYHYTDVQDIIIRTPTGAVINGSNEVTKLNSDGGYVQGVEFGASVRPHPDVTLFGHLAWLDGEVDTFPTSNAAAVREPIDRLMPLNGQLGARYDHPNDAFWVEGALTIFDDADELSSRDRADTSRIPTGGTPGYEILSVRAGWRLADSVDLTLALENLTDEDYRVHGSGLNAPGRSLHVTVEFTF